jgi:dipeptidyl aminopeptidase/acylaminoacyl peptidase
VFGICKAWNLQSLEFAKLGIRCLGINRIMNLKRPAFIVLGSLVLAISTVNLKTNMAQTSYQLPPQEVIDVIDAKPEPAVSLSPNGSWMMFVQRDAMPSIGDVARRQLRLAGLRIDPQADSRFAASYWSGVSLRKTERSTDPPIEILTDSKVASVTWSHDSKHFAVVVVADSGQQLWRGSVDSPKQLRMLTDRYNSVMGGFTWMPNGIDIACRLVPEDRGAEPVPNLAPPGPNVQQSLGNKSPTRTYQDLLQNEFHERLFEHYATTQLAIFDADGNQQNVGSAGIVSGFQVSPSGEFVMTTTIKKPYSYLMTYRSFPRWIQLHQISESSDQETPVRIFAKIPMDENIPIEGVKKGPRSVGFRAGRPATLVWFEALDGGDPNAEVDFRDEIVMQAVSFTDTEFSDQPATRMKVQHRAFGTSFFEDERLMLVSEYDRDRRWVRTRLHDASQPEATPKTMTDRSIRDSYGDPGRMVTKADASGYSVARQDGDWVYRTGAGASPKGNLPFIDRQNIKTLETQRLWRCAEGEYESISRVVNSGEGSPSLITVLQSKTTPPNYYKRVLDDAAAAATKLTDFKDPTPQIRGIKKQRVTYKRADGVDLSATLYLPADYQEGTRLPLLVWAYPREFNDAKTAGQISGSTDRFTMLRGITHLSLLTQGYTIMDAATMPIVGDPETMNDTFIKQIVDSAAAAIDKAVEMGVADRDRVAVGGHSYGAFMTANLMAHCDLFKAGVARSGAYNRTLTPFGFQSERRPYWQAKEIYHKISPFLNADQINEPLLLIHGENDNNSGTFPVQSKRMYQAIKGNGGTVRLCMLPFESHGYRARESVLHTQAEMINWLDTYVKNASPNDPKPTP